MFQPPLDIYDEEPSELTAAPPRLFIGVHFKCCNVYARIYRAAADAFYSGVCPKCAARVRAAVGADGTTARMFTAG
jgi:hypothetical protein